jgi:hypothetical protein
LAKWVPSNVLRTSDDRGQDEIRLNGRLFLINKYVTHYYKFKQTVQNQNLPPAIPPETSCVKHVNKSDVSFIKDLIISYFIHHVDPVFDSHIAYTEPHLMSKVGTVKQETFDFVTVR